MTMPSQSDFRTLMEQHNGPCISMFLPTHRARMETQQDRLRLRNHIRAAENRLLLDNLRSTQIEHVLQPMQALFEDEQFWLYPYDGLALFRSPDMFRTYWLPTSFHEQVVVTDHFYLKPLLPFLTDDGRFSILALSQHAVRLLEATHYSISEVDLPAAVPTNLAEALKHDEPENELQYHSSSSGVSRGKGGRRATIFHGQGVGIDDSKEHILRYFRQIDRGLHELLRDEKAPLMLACVAFLFPLYRQVNTYPHLLDQAVPGNPDKLGAETLRRQVWTLIEPYFLRAREEAAARYRADAGTERASCTVREIVPAVYHGRVERLFIAIDQELWGIFVPPPTWYTCTARQDTRMMTCWISPPPRHCCMADRSMLSSKQRCPVADCSQQCFATDHYSQRARKSMNETRVLSEQEERSSPRDFAALLNALSRPGAYPFALPGDGAISIIQTHASAVLLTPERVYKLKKPKDFGFFDYSTPALRRHFCGEEVRLNRRLAPQVYLGVAPVLAFSDGQVRFGPTYPPDDVPMPGSTLDGGYVVDYAVVMVRLPDDAMLESRVRHGMAYPALLAEIARYVAAFHAATQTDEHIASFGLLDVIWGNWGENFAQMGPYIGRTLDAPTYDRISDYIYRFLDERASLFASRVRDHRIRDCHGDLRLQHIYILNTEDDPTHRLAILDGIEFNERFRYSDVASEIAFLTMELDAASRCDLSRAFIESYIAETGDETLLELLPFYACYRACVRGKVLSFQLDEPEVPEPQHELARVQAASLFAQAASYASGPTRPTLLLVGGLMGTGKSTLALALQHELGWALFSSDAVRKHLAHLDPAQPRADAFGQGIYSPAWTARTYRTLLHEASAALANGRSVLLDASFLRRTDRLATARAAAAHGANAMFVECVCPREVSLERLARRWKLRTEGIQGLDEEFLRASDGRPDLYDAQCAAYEPFVSAEEPGTGHLAISTTWPLVANVEQVLDALHTPRFACWL